jgi:hypothetical protein
MPTIPVYENQRVTQAPISNAKVAGGASAESFGGNSARQLAKLGAGLTDTGNLLLELRAKEKEKDDRVVAQDLLNQATLEAHKTMQTSVLERKGLDAKESEKTASDAMTVIRKKYLDLAKDKRQKELFTSQFDNQAGRHIGDAVSHWSREREDANKKNSLAATQLAADEVLATTLAKPDGLTQAALSQKLAAAEKTIADSNASLYPGVPGAAALKTKQDIGKLHEQVANAYASTGNYDMADTFIKANMSKLDPVEAAKLTGAIDTKRQYGAVLGLIQKGATEQDVFAHVAKTVTDPSKADDLVNYGKSLILARDKTNALDQKAATEASWRRVEDSLNPLDIDQSLPAEERHKQRAYIEARTKKGEEGIVPDLVEFKRLMALDGDGLIALQKSGKMSDAVVALGGTKSKWYQAFQSQMEDRLGGKVDPEAKAAAHGTMSDLQRNGYAFDEKWVKIGNELKGPEYKAALGQYQLRYEQELLNLQATKKKGEIVTPAEKTAINLRLLPVGEKEEWGRNPKVLGFQVAPGEKFIQAVPPAVAAVAKGNSTDTVVKQHPTTGNWLVKDADGTIREYKEDGSLAGSTTSPNDDLKSQAILDQINKSYTPVLPFSIPGAAK